MSEQHGQQKARPATEQERSGCCGGHKHEAAGKPAPAQDVRKTARKQGCCQ